MGNQDAHVVDQVDRTQRRGTGHRCDASRNRTRAHARVLAQRGMATGCGRNRGKRPPVLRRPNDRATVTQMDGHMSEMRTRKPTTQKVQDHVLRTMLQIDTQIIKGNQIEMEKKYMKTITTCCWCGKPIKHKNALKMSMGVGAGGYAIKATPSFPYHKSCYKKAFPTAWDR